MVKISIVVPIYNGERYLERCIRSIINQTFKDLEIILVDDASKDCSLEICYDFAKKDSRVTVVELSVNRGVANARNKGLEVAQGKYIMFCDCDDWVNADWCEIMYNTIERNPLAWITCGFLYTYIEYARENVWDRTLEKIVEKPVEEYGSFVGNDMGYFSVWNKIFNKSILEKNKIKFNENISISEDCIFVAEYCKACDRILEIRTPLYNYNMGTLDSLTKIYHKDLLEARYEEIKAQLPLISDKYIEMYCCDYGALLVKALFNELKKENKKNIIKKFFMITNVMKTEEYQFLIVKTNLEKEGSKIAWALKQKNAFFVLFFNWLHEIKNILNEGFV